MQCEYLTKKSIEGDFLEGDYTNCNQYFNHMCYIL